MSNSRPMQRILLILLWSVIAAAFIGPGTITTCSSSGASHGLGLLWVLAFATFACFVLQEASARVTVLSGKSLAEAISFRTEKAAVRWTTVILILGAILVGCAAYEAGNILGAVSGAVLAGAQGTAALTIIVVAVAFMLLWFGTVRMVARVMGLLVAVMGAAFLATAIMLQPAPGDLLRGLLIPTLPPGSSILVLGLIGTTVVPYNLFLGSGLAHGQRLAEVRLGLGVAITAGGFVSMAVLVVGTSVQGAFSFDNLAETLTGRLGGWAGILFAIGLFAAGFSSAVTAPLAAAMTAQGLFGKRARKRWAERGWRYRGVWSIVLLAGLLSGLSGVRPVPAILLVQALNGLLLPIVAVFLLLVVNDRSVMGARGMNGVIGNVAMGLCTVVALVLGISKILRSAASALSLQAPGEITFLIISAGIAVVLAVPISLTVRKARTIRDS